jgi:hypothetical protein
VAEAVSIKARSEDYSTILYLVPFVAAVVYGLALWVQTGVSLLLPSSVYLTVTRDPYLFMLGSLAVMLGIVVEVNGTDQQARQARLASLRNTMQSMAMAALILVLFFAWYANGFTDLSGMASDFIVGRYGLVFPAILVLLSYLISARIRLASLLNRKGFALIAIVLVPVPLYELGKRSVLAGLVVALLLLVGGLVLYLAPEKKLIEPKEE